MPRRFRHISIIVLSALVGCAGQHVATGAGADAVAAGPRTGTAVSADGVPIAYTVHRLAAPTLVLVHGWMCDQTYWESQIPQLVERFGVVTVDLAGHGASGGGREEWSIGSLGADVVAVIDSLGLDRVVVAGHSMGGRVALEVARELPDRVIGVIGVDTLHDADAELDASAMAGMLRAFEEDFVPSCRGFVGGMFVPGTDPRLVERITDDMCSGPADTGAALLRAYVEYDIRAGFAEAGVPIRAVNSDLWPTDVEGNRELSDFDCTLLEGRGHFLMQEAPDELARAVLAAAVEIAGS